MTTSAIYDRAYFDRMREGDALRAVGRPSLYDAFLAILDGMPLQRMRVLDAGCGRGELAVMLRKAGAAHVVGIDFSPEAVQRAKTLARDVLGDDHAVRIVHGSLQEPGVLPPASFDLVLMTDVVEHLPPDVLRDSLANIGAWMKPDATLFVHTFPTLGLHRLYNGVMRLAGRGAVVEHSNRIHCNVQTRRRLRRTLAAAGFACDRMWLRNDFARTSSVYQNIRSPRIRRLAKLVADDLPGSRIVVGVLGAVGLAEFARPSIYCLCRKRADAETHGL